MRTLLVYMNVSDADGRPRGEPQETQGLPGPARRQHPLADTEIYLLFLPST